MQTIFEIARRHDAPLLLFSQKTFVNAYQTIQACLPQVKHHYAVKALPLEQCITALQTCDGYLDLASVGEMEMVRKTAPHLLLNSIYTHPIKKKSDIETALSYGISVMVADNAYELEKLAPYKHKVKLLLRISFPNEQARCNLSQKFGVPPTQIRELIQKAVSLGFNIIGCCFHVGSQMPDPAMHLKALAFCRELYDWAKVDCGLFFRVLDIGGGFPACLSKTDMLLRDYCAPISRVLEEQFSEIEIWSEPGRCLAADCMLSVAQIQGKSFKNGSFWYYLDDGVYNSYSGNIFDHAAYRVTPVLSRTGRQYPTVFAGPTCDSIDVIQEETAMTELEIGDYVLCPQIGAYSWASRTNFNDITPVSIVEVDFDLTEYLIDRGHLRHLLPQAVCVYGIEG